MEINIKNVLTGEVLFTCEADNMREAVEKAVTNGANLDGANLAGANLYGANLAGAYLYGANLAGANLYGANLYGANLYGANLDGANLAGANLAGANLAGAYLYGANLDGANLYGANLAGANLAGAYLYGANLAGETLSITPVQVLGLTWPVLITPRYMRIGCQRHTHDDWEQFGESDISGMERRATAFWSCWREPLLAICAEHRKQAEEGVEK